jgi:hypothetical protein
MRRVYWATLVAILIIVFGVVFGIAGVVFFPILGGLALVVLAIWLLQRRARDKPPLE